jgi:hypothetical protein
LLVLSFSHFDPNRTSRWFGHHESNEVLSIEGVEGKPLARGCGREKSGGSFASRCPRPPVVDQPVSWMHPGPLITAASHLNR